MPFDLQPRLENPWIGLRPLLPADFEPLYAAASDPLIWQQHPNPNRYQRAVFENYFQGAIESGGALLISDNQTGQIIGSSRYYDLDETRRAIAIGYTFIARQYWGRDYNRRLKTLMLDHAFHFVDTVVFHVGADNTRSRIAMQKLGGQLTGEIAVAYYGEPSRQNVIYEIKRADWQRLRRDD
jgi:RimJ/RimL family protein N-acetyltransferase